MVDLEYIPQESYESKNHHELKNSKCDLCYFEDNVVDSNVVIQCQYFRFEPQHISVPIGTQIVWSCPKVSDEPETHCINFSNGGYSQIELSAGETCSLVLDRPGNFQYSCSYYPFMNGSINVEERGMKYNNIVEKKDDACMSPAEKANPQEEARTEPQCNDNVKSTNKSNSKQNKDKNRKLEKAKKSGGVSQQFDVEEAVSFLKSRWNSLESGDESGWKKSTKKEHHRRRGK